MRTLLCVFIDRELTPLPLLNMLLHTRRRTEIVGAFQIEYNIYLYDCVDFIRNHYVANHQAWCALITNECICYSVICLLVYCVSMMAILINS
jgi:hypothetical protein